MQRARLKAKSTRGAQTAQERLAKIEQERRAILTQAEATAEGCRSAAQRAAVAAPKMLLTPVSNAIPALDAAEDELDAVGRSLDPSR